MTSDPIGRLLDTLEVNDGVYSLSAPRHYHYPVDTYDQQYGIDTLTEQQIRADGVNLLDFAEREGWPPGTPILEIGCGTGRISLALATQGRVGRLLVTDAAPGFLQIVKRKLVHIRQEAAQVHLVVVNGEDLAVLPGGAFGLVVLRSVLHHIEDVEAFLHQVSRLLQPGGIMMCEEPYYEGYQLMGFAAQVLVGALARDAAGCSAEEEDLVRRFAAAMQFYCRRDISKSDAEDKHLFRPEELLQSAGGCGLRMSHFPNWFITASEKANIEAQLGYFQRFFGDYLLYCMSWPAGLVERSRRLMQPYFEYFEPLQGGRFSSPHCYGVFVFQRDGSEPSAPSPP